MYQKALSLSIFPPFLDTITPPFSKPLDHQWIICFPLPAEQFLQGWKKTYSCMFMLSGTLLYTAAACESAKDCLLLVSSNNCQHRYKDSTIVWETAKTYLVVKSARVSSFSDEDMRGRENAGKRSEIQHFHSFPPSSQHSKRFIMQPKTCFHDSPLSGAKEKTTFKSQWRTKYENIYIYIHTHTEKIRSFSQLCYTALVSTRTHISYRCRIFIGAFEADGISTRHTQLPMKPSEMHRNGTAIPPPPVA